MNRVNGSDYPLCNYTLLCEVSPQISVVTSLAQKSFWHMPIFDEIHGVWSNFLHGLPVELRTAVCQTLSSPRT